MFSSETQGRVDSKICVLFGIVGLWMRTGYTPQGPE
jgi:hypothetical protein